MEFTVEVRVHTTLASWLALDGVNYVMLTQKSNCRQSWVHAMELSIQFDGVKQTRLRSRSSKIERSCTSGGFHEAKVVSDYVALVVSLKHL